VRHVAALAAVVAAFVAVPGGVVSGSAACADDETRFAIVVDFGDAAGAPSGNTVTCVPVDSDDTAADALVARARMLGRPVPRYNNAGLLCSIDGFPESGCGERSATGYRYWSYWFGGDAWSYASTGPAFHRAKPGGVVGWRFHDAGAGNPSDPPPRASAQFADLCSPPPTTSAPSATSAPATPSTTGSATTAAATPATASSSTALPAPEPSSTTSSAVPPLKEERADNDTVAIVEQENDDDSGSSWPVAVGGLAVAATVGAAAAIKSRRR
jgi:hypothetical protein